MFGNFHNTLKKYNNWPYNRIIITNQSFKHYALFNFEIRRLFSRHLEKFDQISMTNSYKIVLPISKIFQYMPKYDF